MVIAHGLWGIAHALTCFLGDFSREICSGETSSYCGALWGLYGNIIGKTFGHVLDHFIAHILNMVFQNGDSIILLHGAIVNSNFNEIKCRNLDFHCFLEYWNG